MSANSRKEAVRLRLQKKEKGRRKTIHYFARLPARTVTNKIKDVDFCVPCHLSPGDYNELTNNRGGNIMICCVKTVIPKLSDRPECKPLFCMICKKVIKSTDSICFGSPMFIPEEGKTDKKDNFIREKYRKLYYDTPNLTMESELVIERDRQAHIRDISPFIICRSEECNVEARQRQHKAERDLDIQMRKAIGEGISASYSCSVCDTIVPADKQVWCVQCHAKRYCTENCKEKDWSVHKEHCIPLWKTRKEKRAKRKEKEKEEKNKGRLDKLREVGWSE